MPFRLSLKNLIRRDPTASLRDRANDLRANLSRRAVVAGSVAAAVPLPVIANSAAPSAPHPDQALLDLAAAQAIAKASLDVAETAYRAASAAVDLVLLTCPADLRVQNSEYRTLTHPLAWSGRGYGYVRFRYIPRGHSTPDIEHWETQAWTGAALRQVIARAPMAQGRGGRTPALIRRWKALLPTADAFDARVEAAKVDANYSLLSQKRDAAIEAHKALTAAIEKSVATTPEGMAVLVRAIQPTPWKDVWGAWPNLLRSAAVVSGIDPASLEHEYDSHRPYTR